MSKQDRGGGRQKGFSFRLPSWASATQRSPSQRQPSRVTTTTLTQPPPPPSPPQQRTAAAAAAAPARRSSRAAPPPVPSPPTKPQMGTAPSRPASEPYPTSGTRAPTSSSSQPPARAPSRQLSRTFTQPPQSPPSDRLQPTTLVPPPPPPPRGPSPSPPPEQPASPPRPKALSIPIPPLAPPTPPVASSTPPSPPEKFPPSPVQELPAERPPPTTQVLQLQPTPTEHAGEMEEEEATPAAPAAAAPTDMPIELESRPVPPAAPAPAPAAAAGDEPMALPPKSPTTILTHPSADFTSQPRELGTPPVEKTILEELTPTRDVGLQDTATPPKPETEQLEGREGDQPAIRPEAGRESTAGATLPRDVEERPKPEQVTEGEREKLQQHQPVGPSDRITPKDIAETKPGEPPKEENGTLKTIPVGPTPDQEPHQIKDRKLEEAPTVVEAEQRPTQVSPRATQPPIKEVEVPEAGQPPVPPPPPPPPPPPNGAKGKEGKIAISTLARTSTSSREQSGSLHKEIKEGISRLVQSLAVQHSKQPGGGERGGISIITLAGENQGASMYVGRGGTTSTRESKGVHVHNGRDVTVEDGQKRETGDKSSSSSGSGSGSSTSVNSNVQTINNSILHESCCSEDNPGVHVVMSTRSPEESAARAAEMMQKSRCRAALPQKKLAMEPTVRRRCLRALFLESSDDDAQKPRRHGCRFGCADDVKKKKAINGGDHAGTSLSGVNTTTAAAADQGKKIAREGV